MCYQKMNQMNESCFYNDQCLELNPSHVKARFRKAVICAHDKEFNQALEAINGLIAEDPSSDDFQVQLGKIQTLQAEHEAKMHQAMKINTSGTADQNSQHQT